MELKTLPENVRDKQSEKATILQLGTTLLDNSTFYLLFMIFFITYILIIRHILLLVLNSYHTIFSQIALRQSH